MDKRFRAFYDRRDGAHCIRQVSYSEAMDMLRFGRFNAKQVRVEDENGDIYGIRRQAGDLGFTDLPSNRWLWFWCDHGTLT